MINFIAIKALRQSIPSLKSIHEELIEYTKDLEKELSAFNNPIKVRTVGHMMRLNYPDPLSLFRSLAVCIALDKNKEFGLQNLTDWNNYIRSQYMKMDEEEKASILSHLERGGVHYYKDNDVNDEYDKIKKRWKQPGKQ